MLTASLLLVARRTSAHARLLSAVVIGVVLAVTVISSTVIYFDSLRTLSLKRSLEIVEPAELDLLVELALGLVARVAPALNVMTAGAPIRVLAGLLVIAASLTAMPGVIQRYMPAVIEMAAATAGAFR